MHKTSHNQQKIRQRRGENEGRGRTQKIIEEHTMWRKTEAFDSKKRTAAQATMYYIALPVCLFAL